ncbi:MAG: hypothetical protein ABSA34_02595 [Candidatus Goldiibacteriota bacterium]|jgi:tetratricopeptide (TPR) repeat protein
MEIEKVSALNGGYMKKFFILILFLLCSPFLFCFTIEPSLTGGAQFSCPLDDFGIMISNGSDVYSLEGYRQAAAAQGMSVSWSESRFSPLLGGGLLFEFSDDLLCSLRFSYIPGFSYSANFDDTANHIMYSQKAGIGLLTISPGISLQYTLNDSIAFFVRAEFPGVTVKSISFSQKEALSNGDIMYDYSSTATDYEYYYSAGIGAKWRINSMVFITLETGYSSAADGINFLLTAGFDPSGINKPAVTSGISFADFEKKGDTCFGAGDYKCAFEWYSECISINKTAEIYKKAGDCLFFSGHKDTALAYYNYSLKLEKNSHLSDFIKKNY